MPKDIEALEVIKRSSSPLAKIKRLHTEGHLLVAKDRRHIRYPVRIRIVLQFGLVKMHTQSKEKTALTTGKTLKNVLHVGRCNVPATFKEFMETVLQAVTWCKNYLRKKYFSSHCKTWVSRKEARTFYIATPSLTDRPTKV